MFVLIFVQNLATENLDEVFKRSVSSLPHLTPTEVCFASLYQTGSRSKSFGKCDINFKFCFELLAKRACNLSEFTNFTCC